MSLAALKSAAVKAALAAKHGCMRLLGRDSGPAVANMTSGRTWERVPNQYQPTMPSSVNETTYVWDANEHSVRGFFKCPKPRSEHGSPYSIGIERVYYELAHELGVPVCDTYLEEFRGQRGLISMRAPGAKSWDALSQDIIDSAATFVDADKWPLALALDVLLGNTDRHEQNIYVQWNPPGYPPRRGEQCATWFIDFGHCGLWPPRKFNAGFGPNEILRVAADADLLAEETNRYRNRLPSELRRSFPPRGSVERGDVVRAVRQTAQNLALEAVRRVSGHYFTHGERELTLRWVRNPRLDTLVDVVFL